MVKETKRKRFDEELKESPLGDTDYILSSLLRSFDEVRGRGNFSKKDRLEFSSTPDREKKYYEAWYEVMGDIARIALELQQLLRLEYLPRIEFSLDIKANGALTRRGEWKLLINFQELNEFLLQKINGEERVDYLVKQYIKTIIAHELGHFYTYRNYPSTFDRSYKVCKSVEPWDYYLDRGELFCNLFAISYLSQNFGKDEEEIKDDHFAALSTSVRIKKERRDAKKIKKRTIRNRKIKKLANKFFRFKISTIMI